MSRLQLYSEPFARTGNMAAEGFKRLLGRPALELLPSMLREGIQNVLDAGNGRSGATVLIRLRTLTPEQQHALSERLLAERPRGDVTRADIDASLAKPALRVLELSDFGTVGLSGPTRADTPHDGEEPLNFVNFLRNVGAGRDTPHGGGTYGYGKSSLYAMSGCSTIVVDSQTRCAGRDERRFMACHLGTAFDATLDDGERRRFTGRHWWGVLDGDTSVEPIVGDRAVELSSAIGMPARNDRQTGTSILIIDPLMGRDDMRSSIDDIIESVLWNFWPRMTASTPVAKRLSVEVELEGERIGVPLPEDLPPLDLLSAAMAEHRTNGSELIPIRCDRPKRLLGNVAIRSGLRTERRGPATRPDSIIPKQASHIALMRPVELVVKYIEGEPLPDRRFEWAGVFICSGSEDIEEAFANAEPPAHDDWIPDNLPKGSAKTFVRVAMRRLNELAHPQARPSAPASDSDGQAPSLAAIASRMGRFLDRVSATGPGKPLRAPGVAPARRSLSITAPRFSGLVLDANGRGMAKFRAELHNDASDSELYLVAEPHLVVDGGTTASDDLPSGFALGVARITLGDFSTEGAWIHAGHQAGDVEVMVPIIPGAALGLKLRLRSGRPE